MSERALRYSQGHEDKDDEFSKRIWELLGSREDIFVSDCDAVYFDFSVIPSKVQQELQLWRDHYLIYGVTQQGEFASKWVDRWELDGDPN